MNPVVNGLLAGCFVLLGSINAAVWMIVSRMRDK